MIKSEQIFLKPLQISDADRIINYHSHDSVKKYQGWNPKKKEDIKPLTLCDFSSVANHVGKGYQLGIYLSENGHIIGDCYIEHFETRQVEIGFTVDPDFQRQGIASQALTLLLDYIFKKREIHRVVAKTHPLNIPSRALLLKLKFRQEGHLIKSFWNGTEWEDDVCFGLLAEEWLE
ncbi:MAG: GNAT family N-acetyltransferase [bacterium]